MNVNIYIYCVNAIQNAANGRLSGRRFVWNHDMQKKPIELIGQQKYLIMLLLMLDGWQEATDSNIVDRRNRHRLHRQSLPPFWESKYLGLAR